MLIGPFAPLLRDRSCSSCGAIDYRSRCPAEIAEPITGSPSGSQQIINALQSHIQSTSGDWGVQRAFSIFQAAQLMGWAPAMLATLSNQRWQIISNEVEAFSAFQRRHVFQMAYEYRYNDQRARMRSVFELTKA